MPIIQNKKTGRSYPVTEDQMNSIKGNPMTKALYLFPDEVRKMAVPPEVQKLRDEQRKEMEALQQQRNDPPPPPADPGEQGGSNEPPPVGDIYGQAAKTKTRNSRK